MTLTLLGTGTSIGIPVPGCDCAVCRSGDSRDRRTRASAVFEEGNARVLVDTATEFRLQAVDAGIDRLDAVVWTHAHADHVHGLDDLRSLTWRTPITGYANRATREEIRERFSYIWRAGQKGGGKPRIDLRTVAAGEKVTSAGMELIPIPVFHGELEVFGWRAGHIAYLTDVSRIPETSYGLLEDLDILVIEALRFEKHPTHFNVDEAVAETKKIRPGRAYLTHIGHEASHRELIRFLPTGIEPAHDGLRLRDRREPN